MSLFYIWNCLYYWFVVSSTKWKIWCWWNLYLVNGKVAKHTPEIIIKYHKSNNRNEYYFNLSTNFLGILNTPPPPSLYKDFESWVNFLTKNTLSTYTWISLYLAISINIADYKLFNEF